LYKKKKQDDKYVFKMIHNRCDSLFRVYEIRYDASKFALFHVS